MNCKLLQLSVKLVHFSDQCLPIYPTWLMNRHPQRPCFQWLIPVQRIFSATKREFVHSASAVLVGNYLIWQTNKYTFLTYSQSSTLYNISDVEWGNTLSKNIRQITWFFVFMFWHGHLLYEILIRKRIKNIIQLCVDWCLSDRFETVLFRIRVQIWNIICLILLERAIFGNYHAYVSLFSVGKTKIWYIVKCWRL